MRNYSKRRMSWYVHFLANCPSVCKIKDEILVNFSAAIKDRQLKLLNYQAFYYFYRDILILYVIGYYYNSSL